MDKAGVVEALRAEVARLRAEVLRLQAELVRLAAPRRRKSGLAARNAEIIALRSRDPLWWTYGQLGRHFGMTGEAVRKVISRSKADMSYCPLAARGKESHTGCDDYHDTTPEQRAGGERREGG
jgi:hypothetical protein